MKQLNLQVYIDLHAAEKEKERALQAVERRYNVIKDIVSDGRLNFEQARDFVHSLERYITEEDQNRNHPDSQFR